MGLLSFIPAIGPALDAASNIISAHSASNAFAHRYQTEVADLKAAGLNPALAYGQNPGTPPPSTSLGDIGSSAAHAAGIAANAKQAQATAENTKAQTALLTAQTADLIDNLKKRNANIATDTDLKNAQAHNETERLNILKQQSVLAAQDAKFNERTMDDRVAQVKAALKQQGIDIDIATIQKELSELQKPEAEAMSNFFKGNLGKWSPAINTALDALGKIAHPLSLFTPQNSTSAGSTETTHFFKGGHTTTRGPSSTTTRRRF